MAIGNVELMHECSHEHLYIRTSRLKYNKETADRVYMERRKASLLHEVVDELPNEQTLHL